MERFFLKDEIMRNNKRLRTLHTAYRAYWTKAHEFLSMFDTVRLSRHLAELDEQTEWKTKSKHDRLIMILRHKPFVTALSDGKKHIQNLSDYVLSDTQEFVPGHGLNFCLPPKTVCKEQLFAEFESLWAQLQHHKACSIVTRNALKARLTDLAHSYSNSHIEKHEFLMQDDCYQTIKKLCRNEKILITRPDKGSGVVILNKSDYVTKMGNILNDASKFECLGPAATADRTATIKTKLQN